MKKISLFCLLLVYFSSMAFAAMEDTWNGLLDKYAYEGEKNRVKLILVDYQGLKTDPMWRKLLQEVKNAPQPATGNAEIAFWINIYNIGAVKMIVDNYPLKSIRDKSGLFNPVWGQPIITARGKRYSLGYIEHEILRKIGEPRIHFAIVCASVSCPDLRQSAFNSASLSYQLDEQAMNFLHNKKKGFFIDKEKRKIYISSIFKWFQDDFGDVRSFLAKYLPEYEKELLDKTYEIEYLHYDWALNGLFD
ncbi:DUF547 domain-containing protein [Candidatus Margulisiibacteriota bacterium]